MRILHLISDLDFESGGPAKACVDMAQALAGRGHNVKIFTTTYSRSKDHEPGVLRENGLEIYYFSVHFPRFWKTSFSMAKALSNELASVDVVHIHSLYLFHNLVGGFLARWAKVPYIIRPHSILHPYIFKRHRIRKFICEKLFENRNLRLASAIHYTAEEERDLAKPYVFGAKSLILPLGLNISDYQNLPVPGTFKNSYPKLHGKKIVLFLGRINFKKGFDILIPAFKKLCMVRPEAHLVIAGPDSDGYQEQVIKFIAQEGIASNVSLVGSLRGEQKLAAFVDSELFVLPSYAENFGIAVVEAMACGLQVLVSDQVNIWREIKKMNAGIVVPCNSEQLTQALLDFFNQQKSTGCGENGKRLVRAKYDWDTLAEQYEAAYREIVKKHLCRYQL